MAGPERKNSRQPPWESGANGERLSFGSWLRRQREIREIPLREIADVTKISVRYLEALEQDRFDILPAPVFAKGFLREYSRYVGLDPDEVVNSFLIALEPDDEDAEPDASAEGPSRQSDWVSGMVLVLAVVALLVVVASLIVYAGRNRERQVASPPPIAPPPVAAVEPPPEPPAEPAIEVPLLVTMDFTEDCWVEMEVDGERRVSELHVQGESIRVEAEARVVLTLGNPAGVRIEVNGRHLEIESPPGRVARDVIITPDTVTELQAGE